MIAYIDSSVLLRIVLGQPGALEEWSTVERGIASALIEVECLRAVDRLRFQGSLSSEELASSREAIYRILDSLEIVEIDSSVLSSAARPMPTPLGTLDAIHLATCLLWQEQFGEAPVMATHDHALAIASRASGLRVVGV